MEFDEIPVCGGELVSVYNWGYKLSCTYFGGGELVSVYNSGYKLLYIFRNPFYMFVHMQIY